MKPVFVYPGTFCPPTYGHLVIVRKAAKLFPREVLNIVCSSNPGKKDPIFSDKECADLWGRYDLPKNAAVWTFGEFLEEEKNRQAIIMIRGIRNEEDLDYEKSVVLLNQKHFGIKNYLYIMSDCLHQNISSSRARQAAQELDLIELSSLVSPVVISGLLEKTLRIKNLFMVVGRPGSGKSTFLRILSEDNPENVFINTDLFNDQLRPLLQEVFGTADLIDIAINRREEMNRIIKAPWLELIKKALKTVPENSNVFLEIPYGLQKDKTAFRFLGGNIIYIGCQNRKQNEQRIKRRGDTRLVRFINAIPGKKETIQIAKKHRLSLICIDSSCTLDDLRKKARDLNLGLILDEEDQ